MVEKDWLYEQERVSEVTSQMKNKMAELEREVGGVKEDVIQIRKHFWDEVTVNLSSSDDLIETHFSIRQQAEMLSERERRYRQSAASYKTLTRLVHSPYFGRIDFVEDGVGDIEQIYIGIGSFRNPETDEFLVYDWRAPISSLYYDYGPGPAKYEAPMGEILGHIDLKRQYVIRDGQLTLMFDTGVTIGDELLMQALSRHSDAQMKNIVATIQRDQNRIIRNTQARLLVVQGPAGSGKTSAALQRVAFLLYKYREVLKADQMVLFSPNPLFNSYVSTVLPELGEENMEQTTFQQYLEHRLGAQFQLEDPFMQLEYVLTARGTEGYDTRLGGIAYKSSVEFLDKIHAYTDVLKQHGMKFRALVFEGRVIVSEDAISEQFYSLEPQVRIPQRIELVRDWLLSQVADFQEKLIHEDWVEEEIQFLSDDDYHQAYKNLKKAQRGKSETFDDFAREQEFLSRLVVDRRLSSIRSSIRNLAFVDALAIYRHLFTTDTLLAERTADRPEDWSGICQQTCAQLEQQRLFYEDATPYLYFMELALGLRTNTTVRHVFVDEAQDYSPIQLELIKRLFPRAKMTVLGDMNQSIYAQQSSLSNHGVLEKLYGPQYTETIALTNSYRSTREIVEFTSGMIPSGTEIVTFNRSGEKPTVIRVSSDEALSRQIADKVQSLQQDGYASIAIICKTAEESSDAHKHLSNYVQTKLITKFSPTFEKETLVIPAYLAKGVEFDAVVIYNGSAEQYSHESERNLFYTACTRAMHLLYVYSKGELTPFIQHLSPDAYTMV